jgi:HPt (histidine-containing phosphotransfer) domain-containing protein
MPDFNPDQDLDLSLLNEIADGSDEFIVESIDMFIQQTPLLLNEVSDLIARGDWAAAGSTAHKLKPNLGFFGMLNTQALIQEVELACKAGGANPYNIITKFNSAKATISKNMIALARVRDQAAGK